MQSATIPLAVSLASGGLIRWVGGPGRGAQLAGACVGLGFLAGYLATLGTPGLPPVSAAHKIVFCVGGGVALGLLLDGTARRRGSVAAVALIWGLACTAWIGEARLRAGEWLLAGSAAAFVAIVLLRLATRPASESSASVLVLVAAIGHSALALLGASASIAQASGTVAAATGGFLLWNWPRVRLPYGVGALLGGGGALALVGAQLLLYANASRVGLAILLLALFADDFGPRIPLGGLARRPALRPFVIAAAGALPVLAAIGWAAWRAPA